MSSDNISDHPSGGGHILSSLAKVSVPADFERGVMLRRHLAKLPTVPVPPSFEQDVLNRLHPATPLRTSKYSVIIGAAVIMTIGALWYFGARQVESLNPAQQTQPQQSLQQGNQQSPEPLDNRLPATTPEHTAKNPNATKKESVISPKQDSLTTKTHNADVMRGGKISDDKLNEE